jgi:GT2 family glycosyltransferase
MNVACVIGTYGDPDWQDLAMSRAYPSALAAGFDEIEHVHAETLAQARNEGAMRRTTAEWVVFLDADDELDPEYLAAVRRAANRRGHPPAMLYTPAVSYVRGRKVYRPRFNREVRPQDGNWLVIGTTVPRRLFVDVGGFEEWPLYEDWALFARMQKAGAEVAKVPTAVYRAHYRPASRNHPVGGRAAKLATHDAIRRAVYPELYEEAAA